jgi:hypothetical protein
MWRALAIAAALVGCTKVTYVNPLLMPDGVEREHTGDFYLYGLVGHADIWANLDCPQGVARVVSQFTFGDLVYRTFTLGIYTPRTYVVECAAVRP